jgi:hypothetical protein
MSRATIPNAALLALWPVPTSNGRTQHEDPREVRQRPYCAVSVRRITDDDFEVER